MTNSLPDGPSRKIVHKRSLEILDMIREDMEKDVHKWEGQEITPRVLSVMYGELSGTLYGLAGVLKALILLDQQEEEHRGQPKTVPIHLA